MPLSTIVLHIHYAGMDPGFSGGGGGGGGGGGEVLMHGCMAMARGEGAMEP